MMSVVDKYRAAGREKLLEHLHAIISDQPASLLLKLVTHLASGVDVELPMDFMTLEQRDLVNLLQSMFGRLPYDSLSNIAGAFELRERGRLLSKLREAVEQNEVWNGLYTKLHEVEHPFPEIEENNE
jgi:hypothetical protein